MRKEIFVRPKASPMSTLRTTSSQRPRRVGVTTSWKRRLCFFSSTTATGFSQDQPSFTKGMNQSVETEKPLRVEKPHSIPSLSPPPTLRSWSQSPSAVNDVARRAMAPIPSPIAPMMRRMRSARLSPTSKSE